MPDDELVRRHRTGDATALPILVARWGRELYGFIRSLLHDKDAADDVYQNTLLQAWKAVAADGSYKENGVFRQWLFTVARHACTDHFRHPALPILGEEELQQHADIIPSWELSPEEAAMVAERQEIIMKCIQECLSDEQRAAFILVDLNELKLREAAEVLGVRMGTVISRVDRSRKVLRECLQLRGIEL
jgi:RNA polymerase sigma factor (sigma-70 family)